MSVSYKKLSHLLIERNISHSELRNQIGYSANITARLKKNEYVSLETIEGLCTYLHVGVDDILDFIITDNQNKGVHNND